MFQQGKKLLKTSMHCPRNCVRFLAKNGSQIPA